MIELPSHGEAGPEHQCSTCETADGTRGPDPSTDICGYSACEKFPPKNSNAAETSRALAIMRWRALA
jgi:hypothetical protein